MKWEGILDRNGLTFFGRQNEVGDLDTESKNYFAVKRIFADAFNYLIFDGDPVIKPEELQPVDATGIAIPYGNGARVPIQKYRDLLKLWAAMYDGRAIYVLFGAELQTKIHYAMPVKNMLYDGIHFAAQVEEARRSYEKGRKEAKLIVEGDTLKIKLTSEEFLSGFRKSDRLIPIVTGTVYLGGKAWDGPLCIHDMLDVPDKRILRAIPNYFINLIAPANMDDDGFGKFSTDLGLAMKAIKYQDAGAENIIQGENYCDVDRDTADFLNGYLHLNLVYEEPVKKGRVNMCKAMENYTRETELRGEVMGGIWGLKEMGVSTQRIVEMIMKNYRVSQEYVEKLMQLATT